MQHPLQGTTTVTTTTTACQNICHQYVCKWFSVMPLGEGEGGGQTNLRYKRQKSFDAAAAFFRYLLNAKRKLLCNDKASREDIWRQ